MQLWANNAASTLAGSILSGATTITIAATGNFPVISTVGDYFYSTISDSANDAWEIVKVTATSGTTFTVVRGQDNTSAVGWASGSIFELRPVAQGLRDLASYGNTYIDGGQANTMFGTLVLNAGGAS